MARIFVVEDESIVALELQQRIVDIGHSIAGVADNGKEAIEKVLKTKPDLILMDIHLKGDIDGIQTAQHILSKYRVPIVYLTAYSDDETVNRAKITSPHGYLVKPIEDRELYISIEVSLANFEIEKKLRESERKLSITLQSIGDGVIATDVNGNITIMNPTAERMCGWSFEEAKGLPITKVFNIISAIDREKMINPVEEVLRTGEIVELSNHTVLVSRDGTERHISDSASPIKGDTGEIEGVVLVFSDVTESYKNRELLRQSEKLYRNVVENASDIIYTIDLEGNILQINAAGSKLLGYSIEEIKKMKYHDFISKEYYELVKNHFVQQYIKKEQTTYLEVPIIKRDGQRIWLGSNINLILDGDNIKGFHIISRDITDRKNLEFSLIEAKERAESANRLKDAFIANISHEIRTPLNGLLGMISVLKDIFSPYITENEKKYFDAIDKASNRIIRNIDLILNYSRVQVGEFKTNPQFVKLDEILNDLYLSFSVTAKQKGLALKFEKKVADAQLYSDTYCLNHIFSNLIDNAIKYTNEGSVEIILYRNQEGNLTVDVADTGIGISKEYMEDIFKPYTQERIGYNRSYEGVGLGLSLVKSLVDKINSQISVKSIKGNGSTFTVVLSDMQLANDESKVNNENNLKEKSDTQAAPTKSSVPKVLVVEDEEINQLYLTKKLSGICEVIVAERAEDALDKINKNNFGIILMDISLKGMMDGLQLTKEIKSKENFKHIPVIAMTGHAFHQDKERCLAAGCDDYIAKPFKIDELLAKINKYLAVWFVISQITYLIS